MSKKIETLAKFLIKSIVTKEDEVVVSAIKDDARSTVTVNVKANQEDIPLIIGKKGSIIRPLRNILKIQGLKHKVNVEINIE